MALSQKEITNFVSSSILSYLGKNMNKKWWNWGRRGLKIKFNEIQHFDLSQGNFMDLGNKSKAVHVFIFTWCKSFT